MKENFSLLSSRDENTLLESQENERTGSKPYNLVFRMGLFSHHTPSVTQ